KTYNSGTSGPAAWYIDALDATTGAQRAHFPKKLTGTAQNAPGVTFEATTELQRPGLLLLDGVVYAAFGGHCDLPPYQGWVFGVDAASADIRARWSALSVPGPGQSAEDLVGAGIWQSGAGLMSDGPGRIFISTGNGYAPTPPLATPGGNFGESIVRLAVQPDGSLQAMDFFAPFDAAELDTYDADFASGGVTALRDDRFGTTRYPHVAVAVGKAGYVYLLDRDDLGGIGMGAGNGDDVISRDGPYGGVWSRPAVWPGDGGWISIPTASPAAGSNPAASGSAGHLDLYRYRVAADGTPSLDAPIASDDAFGFGSSAPVITSDGTTSGSAVLWTIWSPDGSGFGAQLRAYDAVPINGHVHLRRSWPIGRAAKFTMPGVGAGRVYVATRDGHLLGFGAPVAAEVQAPATTFGLTTVGQTSTASVQLRIAGTVTINSIVAGDGTSSSSFSARTAGLGIPGTFADGNTVAVPVDFAPTAPGVDGATLTVDTDKGAFTFSLTGTGQSDQALLTASPAVVSFGGAVVGGSARAGTITLANAGAQPLTVTAVDPPHAPFSLVNAPAVGDTIAPGDAINVTVGYLPVATGSYDDALTVTTDAGTKVIGLTGSAGLGPKLTLTPSSGWDFGTVTVGEGRTVAVTVANTGDTALTVTKSKPPQGAAFAVLDGLDEATVIAAGQSRTLRVTFTPTQAGTVTDTWTLNADDGSGVAHVALTGAGADPVLVARDTSTPQSDGSAGTT
ncbi:MAG TPA: choice-of-anchor D domain-containing protein, partial [Baekduia sp.]|nr:choice-of-anchor D domain-containing protein [Baekduia sp.]